MKIKSEILKILRDSLNDEIQLEIILSRISLVIVETITKVDVDKQEENKCM